MLPDRPQIIINSAEHTNIVRDSKFIGYCCPVTSKSQALRKISEIEQLHKKATHVCWAYRVYENNQLLYYADDAGEPHGSAGLPILKALEGRALVNTICLVVRYFGGTKLGIGGLIRLTVRRLEKYSIWRRKRFILSSIYPDRVFAG
jgi:putative IMPACT (imprinted ancient) family translation regulator